MIQRGRDTKVARKKLDRDDRRDVTLLRQKTVIRPEDFYISIEEGEFHRASELARELAIAEQIIDK